MVRPVFAPDGIDVKLVAVYCAAALAALLAAAPAAESLGVEEPRAAEERWRPGEGLREGYWYVYVVCRSGYGAGEACYAARLDFSHAGRSWIAEARFVEIDGGSERAAGAAPQAGEWKRVGWPADFTLAIDPAGLGVHALQTRGEPYADMLRDSLFFFGGTVRVGDGHRYWHDPVLEVGRMWTAPPAPIRTGMWIPDAAVSHMRGSVFVTDAEDGYGFCGSEVDGAVYEVSYLDVARARAGMADGFPFPLYGEAADRAGLGSIRGDLHATRPHWYTLLGHSASPPDADAGGVCRIAAEIADYPRAVPQRERQSETLSIRGMTVLSDGSNGPHSEHRARLADADLFDAVGGPGLTVFVGGVDGGHVAIRGTAPAFDGTISIDVYDSAGVRTLNASVPIIGRAYGASVPAGGLEGGNYTIRAAYGSSTASAGFTVGPQNVHSGAPRDLTLASASSANLTIGYAIEGGNVTAVHAYEDGIVVSVEVWDDGLIRLDVQAEALEYVGGRIEAVLVDGAPAVNGTMRGGPFKVPLPAGAEEVRIAGVARDG